MVLIALLLAGCSERPKRRGFRGAPVSQGVERQLRAALPWEGWSYGRDVEGRALSDPTLLRGDDYYNDGIYDKALAAYEEARPYLQSFELEAAENRTASCQLALDRPTDALETVSRFFSTQNLSEEAVSEPFALVLAYGYGRKGDIDQSVAWFARVNRMARSEVSVDRAKRGLKLLLETVADQELVSLSPTWNTDIFVSSLIGQERSRRARDGVFARSSIGPFWQVGSWGQISGGGSSSAEISAPSDLKRVVVLLPLSGRFASLGQSTKQGMTLAFQSAGFDRAVKVDYVDDAGDSVTAREAFRNAEREGRIDLLVGPLVSEVASAVQELAQDEEVPMLTFSKRSDFRTGNGSYRFGTTVYSQADSLVSLYQKRFYGKRVAFVGPDNLLGQEFREVLLRVASARGVEFASAELYIQGDDISLLMTAEDLEAAKVDVVIFNDEVAPSSRIIGNFSPEARKRIAFIGTALWDSPRELSNSRAAMDGVYFTTYFFQNDQRELTKNFNVAYKAQFSKTADFLAAQGFDAATMVVAAFQREMSEGVKISQALGEVDRYDGLTGSLSSSAEGEVLRDMRAVRYLNGRIRPADAVDTNTGGL
jgi:ABC-type branched-subunit amino acid transport system substrate-binding protein